MTVDWCCLSVVSIVQKQRSIYINLISFRSFKLSESAVVVLQLCFALLCEFPLHCSWHFFERNSLCKYKYQFYANFSIFNDSTQCERFELDLNNTRIIFYFQFWRNPHNWTLSLLLWATSGLWWVMFCGHRRWEIRRNVILENLLAFCSTDLIVLL